MTDDDRELDDTWSRLMGLFLSSRDSMFGELQRLGLTPPHGFALMNLLHQGPVRMREMADAMACDASYVTALADRLEELGLAERRNAAGDRRAKELALTPKGEKVARRLHATFHGPPAALVALDATDRAALARIARKMGEPMPVDGFPGRTLR